VTTLSSYNVSDILLKIAEQDGVNLSVENIDDTALGCLIADDKSFNAFLTQHALPYNYLIIDGDPIRLVRRIYGDAGGIDLVVNQSECIVRDGPVLRWSRVDPFTLPRQVEVQYTDPDRDFATNTQLAHHPGAPTSTPGISIALDFTVTADQARALAFDTLYRIWSQLLSVTFEHPNLAIEPGDVLQIVSDDGTFTMLATETSLTVSRTNEVSCVMLGSATVTAADGIAGVSGGLYEQSGSPYLYSVSPDVSYSPDAVFDPFT